MSNVSFNRALSCLTYNYGLFVDAVGVSYRPGALVLSFENDTEQGERKTFLS